MYETTAAREHRGENRNSAARVISPDRPASQYLLALGAWQHFPPKPIRLGRNDSGAQWPQWVPEENVVALIKSPSRRPLVHRQRIDQPRLGHRQQLREDREIAAAGGAKPERGVHVDADHVATRREPQLALAGEQNLPRLMRLALIKACSR